MINEGKSYKAIDRHFGAGISTIGNIKKARVRICETARITLNMSAKITISPYFKPLISMEAALVKWIVNCRKMNVALNSQTIKMKAVELYETFSIKEHDDSNAMKP